MDDTITPGPETFARSSRVGRLAIALAKAQAEITNATKDATNPHFGSSYATLAAVRDAVTEPLTKHGLAVVQLPSSSGDGKVVTMTCMLILGAEEGNDEWIACQLSAPVAKADPQGIGSAITYLRRYTLAAMTGLATEDDDGNDASRPADRPQTQRQRRQPQERKPSGAAADPDATKPTAEQRTQLRELAGELVQVSNDTGMPRHLCAQVTGKQNASPATLTRDEAVQVIERFQRSIASYKGELPEDQQP